MVAMRRSGGWFDPPLELAAIATTRKAVTACKNPSTRKPDTLIVGLHLRFGTVAINDVTTERSVGRRTNRYMNSK